MCFQHCVGSNAGVIRLGMFSLQRPHPLFSFSMLAAGWVSITVVAASALQRFVPARLRALGASFQLDGALSFDPWDSLAPPPTPRPMVRRCAQVGPPSTLTPSRHSMLSRLRTLCTSAQVTSWSEVVNKW